MSKLSQEKLDIVKDAVDLGVSDDVVKRLTKITNRQLRLYKKFDFDYSTISDFYSKLRTNNSKKLTRKEKNDMINNLYKVIDILKRI